MCQLLREEGELRETTHGEEALQDEGSPGVGRGGEYGPYRADRFTLADG